MEADRLRENPQTPQQQETLQSNHLSCKRLMRLLLAANNQATRRNEIIKSYLQLGSSSNRYASACPNKKQNNLQNSLLRWTQFWVEKLLKPASLKRTSLVVLPVATSHKASLKPKRFASATLTQKKIKKMNLNTVGPHAAQ